MASELESKGILGDFLVRDVKSDANSYGLVVKGEDGKLANFLILRTAPEDPSQGFFIKGAPRDVFPALSDLVHFYANRKRAFLGVQLRLPEDDMEMAQLAPTAVRYGLRLL